MEYNYNDFQPGSNVETAVPPHDSPFGGSGEYYIDWGADVPVIRDGSQFDHRYGEVAAPTWRPISSEIWQHAVAMRPELRIQVRLKFLYPRASSQLCVFATPPPPAPVTSIICIFGSGDQTATYRLFERCVSTITLYSQTLTDIVFLTEVIE